MVNIYDYISFRDFLKAYWDAKRQSDPKFSFRYLSRQLGLSSTNFILLVMQGKRNISREVAFKISQEFKLSEKESDYFLEMVEFMQAKTHKEKDRAFNRMITMRQKAHALPIEEWQYEYYSKWYNLVIRELISYPQFNGDFAWLAHHITPNIKPAQAKKSVELLIKLGFVVQNEKGYSRTAKLVSTSPEVSSVAVVNFHRTMSELAIGALETTPKSQRDITSCTVNVSAKGYERIKTILADCREAIMATAENDTPAEQVFHINLQMFPVSEKIR